MPQDRPQSLSGSQTANVLAYVLQYNGLPPGEAAIPNEADQVQGTMPETAP